MATTVLASQSKDHASFSVDGLHLFILIALLVVTLPLVNPWVRGDGIGYYAYLRATLISHNLHFEEDYLAGNESALLGRSDGKGHLLPSMYTRTGYVENHFSVGPAILWSPVVVPVHFAILAANRFGANIPADGHSRPYLVSMALATAFYAFLSLLLGFQIARKYFDGPWPLFATLGIWFASSLPVYMYFNPSWSHAHSAFAVALFLWYWDRTRLLRTTRQWAVLGLLAGLMGNIYYPNAILLIFPAVEVLYLLRQRQRHPTSPIASLQKMVPSVGLFFLVFVVSLFPTFLTREIIYGSPFATGYPGMTTWNWASPVLLKVLFSSDHGLYSWTPILILATVGFIFLVKRDFLLGLGSILTFLAYFYFIASYADWDGMSSFGNRFFISLTPIFILGLTAFCNACAVRAGNASRAVVPIGATFALFALWNLAFIFQWGTHMVPARGEISWREMAHNQFSGVPARLTRSLETYLTHRKDMMQQIEQEDVEQQNKQHIKEE